MNTQNNSTRNTPVCGHIPANPVRISFPPSKAGGRPVNQYFCGSDCPTRKQAQAQATFFWKEYEAMLAKKLEAEISGAKNHIFRTTDLLWPIVRWSRGFGPTASQSEVQARINELLKFAWGAFNHKRYELAMHFADQVYSAASNETYGYLLGRWESLQGEAGHYLGGVPNECLTLKKEAQTLFAQENFSGAALRLIEATDLLQKELGKAKEATSLHPKPPKTAEQKAREKSARRERQLRRGEASAKAKGRS